MMNDSVREELKDKIIAVSKPLKFEVKSNLPPIEKSEKPIMNKQQTPTVPRPSAPAPSATPSAPTLSAPAPPPAVRQQTTEIAAKPTSPTLVEFQNKNATLPEWRLQLQNAVRKRTEPSPPATTPEPVPAVSRVSLPTAGNAALKAEFVPEPAPVAPGNPTLAKALQRIEESRRRFLSDEAAATAAPPTAAPPTAAPPAAPNKNYPFYLATKNAEVLPRPVELKTPAPLIEELPLIEKKPLDTNKLKPLPNSSVIAASLERVSGELPKAAAPAAPAAPRLTITRVAEEEDAPLELEPFEAHDAAEEFEEADDLAPLAMRFNSGIFDLIIGSFTSLILLTAAFLLSGGNWLSLAGLFAFLVTTAIVMFIYLTTAIGMFGKTIGMKLFSLETIDVEENDYPTFHQAAVSASVYLVSLALGGIGFLPALFNSDRRTAPDLLSGTIVVRE